jgi:hypothetical protein
MNKKYEAQSELFEDEGKFGAMCGAFLLYGIVSFLLIFLIGWLALDSFWWSLIFGLVVLGFFLMKTLMLSMARNEYLEYIDKNAEEGANEMGIDKKKMEKILKSSTKVLEKAARNSNER